MRVIVDPLRCSCTGYCVKLAPHVFYLPASGPVQVLEPSPGPELADLMREAEALCPTNAIRVED